MKNGGTNRNEIESWWREKTKLFDSLSNETFTNIPLQFHIELRVNGQYGIFHCRRFYPYAGG